MGPRTQLGVAAAGGLAYGPLVLLHLPIGIAIWVTTVSLSTVTPAPNVAGVVVFFAWLGAVTTRRSHSAWRIAAHRRPLVVTGALVLWTLLSMAWAPQSSVGTEIFFAWLGAAAIMAVISTSVTTARHLQWLAAAFVIGMVISVGIGVVGASAAGDGRLVGASGDPNFLGAGIVPAIVLAFALAGTGRHVVGRVAALAAVCMLVAGLVGTQSRGGLMAAAIAAVVALVLAERAARGSIVLAMFLTAGTAAVWFSLNPLAWQRMSNLGESSGRTELWRVGWRMWQDHPVAGVGLAGFRHHSKEYLFDLGPLRYAEYLVEQPKLAHNAYLDLLAETGVVGLALFATVVGTCLQCAWRASRRFQLAGDRQMVAFSRATIVAVVGILAASVYISNVTDRRTWILLAMGPALLAASGQSRLHTSPGAVMRAPSSWERGSQPALPRCSVYAAPDLDGQTELHQPSGGGRRDSGTSS